MSLFNKKLIASASPKNLEKARKRLDGTTINLKLMGEGEQRMSCGEALKLGNALLTDAEPHRALAVAEQILLLQNDVVDIYLLKARALLDLEDLFELRELVDDLLSVASDNIGVLNVAARFYLLLGRVKEAFVTLKKINAASPNRIETFSQMAQCYRYSGSGDKAVSLLERCLEQTWKKRFSGVERTAQYRSLLFRYASLKLLNDEMYADLQSFASANDARIASSASYALAQQSVMRKDIAGEKHFLVSANHFEKSFISKGVSLKDFCYENDSVLKVQRKLFNEAIPEWLGGNHGSEHKPIFILGMPRSGTTLLEQILGAHSQVGQTGESKGFSLGVDFAFKQYQPAFSGSVFPMSIDKLPQAAFAAITRHYERHQEVMTSKSMYIDKELHNFNYVGLAAVLFPRAKFIHMNRAPMDIFLSCFKNSIPGVPATSDLVRLAEYYVHMKKLIGHWRSVFGDRILVMNYRDLVEDPETNTRVAADYLEIALEHSMLSFHERKNVVRTLSVDQVRQKIYTSSVEKWRKYEDMLEPARVRLEELGVPLEGVPYIEPQTDAF